MQDEDDRGPDTAEKGPRRRRNPERRRDPERRKRYAGLLDYHQNRQLDRAFLISMRQRYVYCPISKVANSSIKTFLYEAELRNCGFPRETFSFDEGRMHNLLYSPLILPYQLPMRTLRDILFGDDYMRIVFVRNPVERVLSCFLDRVQKARSRPNRTVLAGLNVENIADVSFTQFVDFIATQEIREMDPHWRPVYHECIFDKIQYDQVLRFEDMGTALPKLLEELYPRIARSLDLGRNLSPSVTSAKDRVKEYVTPEARATIEKVYAKDFETFGY